MILIMIHWISLFHIIMLVHFGCSAFSNSILLVKIFVPSVDQHVSVDLSLPHYDVTPTVIGQIESDNEDLIDDLFESHPVFSSLSKTIFTNVWNCIGVGEMAFMGDNM